MRFEAGQMEKLALFFQAGYRGRLGRARFNDALDRRKFLLVSKIQAIIRGRYNFKQIAQQQIFMTRRRNELVTRVQRIARGKLGRHRFQYFIDLRIHNSAARIQALARATRGKKLFLIQEALMRERREIARRKQKELDENIKACTVIQVREATIRT